ncbi:hypothetical protein Pmani_030056 [Petrolisthes manimaculis]|uniref:Uncharacterized protein n=1 Tax=Petrolisthes manimaculis TaxID=1843537 RepID=A0AAE1NY60_9EUCA|nr:hypothetical protein Pmani_030056 [Petrolisthes manimaculis]
MKILRSVRSPDIRVRQVFFVELGRRKLASVALQCVWGEDVLSPLPSLDTLNAYFQRIFSPRRPSGGLFPSPRAEGERRR